MLTSCCGFRLTTAGIIIGWLGAVGSLVGIVLFSVILENLSVLLEFYMHNSYGSTEIDAIRHVIVICITVFIVFAVINLLASALLLLGTAKNRHLLLLPWLVNSGIGVAVSCIGLVITVIGFLAVLFSGVPGLGMAVLHIIFSGLGIAVQIYYWRVIYALYKKIQSENDSVQNPIALNPTSVNYPTYIKL